MTAIIDYGSGNIFSLGSALERIGEKYTVTSEESVILAAERLILPGVGEASHAMRIIREQKLDLILQRSKVPVLGICIGMQLMCRYSEEGEDQLPCSLFSKGKTPSARGSKDTSYGMEQR